ncbi:MAG: alpha/beta hydrolase [Rhodospirillum sp.]|nr:alpha/beta hydrolase [Rhodospirillum sp.]MCF8490720.1 alpha/beta hydrolase [Rhodospirillum sp.]MCF8499381.1 alpha/beta hydrolase [Rhodospirillum sp.]
MSTAFALPTLNDGPANAPLTVILAHGAGAPMDSPFMDAIAQGLGSRGWRVVRFEFPYMARRRTEGVKAPPDRQPKLLETWKAIVAAESGPSGPGRLVIGGKSMGGRMASLLADDFGVAGLLGLGFPFHPPGKPEKATTRCAHLAHLATPSLFCQGTRDSLGSRESISKVPLSPAIRLHWLEDGDHSLKPRKASGRTEAVNLLCALEAIHQFILEVET